MSILRSSGRTRAALSSHPKAATAVPARATLKRQRQAENLIVDQQQQVQEQGPPPAHNTRHFAQRRQSTSSKSSSSNKNTPPPPLIPQEQEDATRKAITPPPSPPATTAATSRKRKHGDDSDDADEVETSVRLVKIDRDPIISAVCSVLASNNTSAAWTARDITAAIIKHKLVDLPHPNPTNVIIQHITSHFRTAREPFLAKEVDERAPRQSKYSLTMALSEMAKLNIDEPPGKRRGSVIKLVVPPSQQQLQPTTKELTPATAIDIMEDARSFDDSALDVLSDAAAEEQNHHHHPAYHRDLITDDLTPLSSALGSPEHDAFLPTPAEEQLPSPNHATHQSNTQISDAAVDGTSNNIDDDEFNTQPQYAMSNSSNLEFDMAGSAVKNKTAPACRVSWESLQDYWDATGVVQSPESVALEDLDSMF